MGIYANTKITDDQGRPTSLERAISQTITIEISIPGLTWTAKLEPGDWTEHRSDCFCCSCESEGDDPACRNHGFAAVRPCDIHNMPGSPWDRSYDDYYIGPEPMPEPVGVERAKQAALRKAYEDGKVGS